jgi:hypothetical protein
MYIKRAILPLFLLALLTIALFPKEVVLRCIAWKTVRYCQEAFGAKFVFDDLAWEEGNIVFKRGKLTKEGELEATFEQASLHPFLDLRRRLFGGELTLDTLRIVHRKKELRPVLSPPSPSFKFFTLHLNTTIAQGELLLYDYLSKNFFFQHAFFDLSHHVRGKQTCGAICFELDPHSPKFTTHFCNEQDKELQLAAHFESQSFPILSHLTAYFFQNYLPEPAFQWDVVAGRVDGDLKMSIIQGTPLKMKGRLIFNEIQGENSPLKLLAEIDHLGCDLDIDFSNISAINGEFDLKGGRVALQENGNFWEGMWDLKNLQSTICVKEGKVESSSLKGSLMGMEGEMVLDWHASEILMQIGFRGSSKEMGSLLPERIQKSFALAFPEDYFALDASLKRSQEGLELGGLLSITDQNASLYQLTFGCLLGGDEGTLPQSLPSPLLQERVPEHLNVSLSHSVYTLLDHLKHQFCLSQKRFGWFQGERFPLEKFLSPFLLGDIHMQLGGLADFRGTFDDRFLAIFYEGRDFDFNTPHFTLHVDSVKDQLFPEITAAHYVDLKTWDHVGLLPLQEAHYWQKPQDFHLEKASALINFENHAIHIQNIATTGDGLTFEGDVGIDIHSLEEIDLKITVNKVSGSATSAQTFLAHFKPSFFWKIPLEGEVLCQSHPLFFHYHFDPVASLVEGELHGEVHFTTSNRLFTLQDYRAIVDYDCKKNEMHIREGLGTLHLPKRQIPLSLSIPFITCFDFPDFLIDFSCVVEEGGSPLLTLNATSQREGVEKKISIEGESLCPYEKIHLKAFQHGKNLNIVEFACGQWKGDSEMVFEEEKIAIKNFTCWMDEKTGFSLSGGYDKGEKTLKADIEQIKWDLGAPFKKSLSPWRPSGEIAGSGSLLFRGGEKKVDAQATVMFNDLEFGGIYFGSGENLRCIYSSASGFSVEGLEVEIPTEEGAEKYKLGRFYYDIQRQKILFEGFDFSLPPEKLPWIAQKVSELFPGKVHPSMIDWVEALKHNEPLEGRISLEVDPQHIWIYLSLKDGTYFLADQKLDLKNFHLAYDPLELHLSSEILYRDTYYWLHLATDSLTMSQGQLALSEHPIFLDNREGLDALIATWERDKEKWTIKKVAGNFCGMEVNLTSKEKSVFPPLSLIGHIGFDPVRMLPLFSHAWRKRIQRLALSGGFALEGEFSLDKLNLESLSFSGQASGTNCQIKNISLDAFSSRLEYGNGHIKVSDLLIKDCGGCLTAHQVQITQDEEGRWYFDLDHACLSDLRLSRLKSPWTKWRAGEKPFFRFLFIPSFVLENVSGQLGDVQTFLGGGKIEFTNLPKRTFLSNLLFIPIEITARIGLDFSNLIPVRGTVVYEIRDGKVYFTEFKDMYSEGKRSRFYLAEGSDAFIDFEGRLNMKVKMKQYNLLMKLAEFFTVSVKGTLLHPSYTFSNHIDENL